MRVWVMVCVAVAIGALAGWLVHPREDAAPVVIERAADPAPIPRRDRVDWKRVYDRAAPAVVTIESVFADGEASGGTGAIIAPDGWIITNDHVVSQARAEDGTGPRRGADRIWVQTNSGDRYPASLVGRDPWSDLALLRVSADEDLPTLPLADSRAVQTGEPVAVIGAPFGLAGSLSTGVVSATTRSIRSLARTFTINDVIQTDAAINRGNSGGPLLDARGRLIGINAQIQTEGDANEGVGYAIPSRLVRQMLPRLRAGGVVEHGYLGLVTQTLTPQMATAIGAPVREGALVQEIVGGTPAADAGLTTPSGAQEVLGVQVATGGDIVTAVNGTPTPDAGTFADVVGALAPGERVTLSVVRADGTRATLTTTTAARPQA